jgi:hypothetical protein
MQETGKQLLNLMFREGETICVSPNKYGYHSMPLPVVMADEVTLLSTKFRDGKPAEECMETYPSDELKLVALNPIQGWRDDASCYKFRNFLIEMDYGPLPEQLAYIKKLEMPYSAIVFSGGKSLHFLISVAEDFKDEKSYRKVAEWILAIVTLADQNTKNPSRSIRIPGAKRDESMQALVELVGPVANSSLGAWLHKWPDLMPREPERGALRSNKRFPRMKPWMQKALHGEFPKDMGRNKTWFAIACEFAIAGHSEDDAIEGLEDYFVPDRDFKKREWVTTIKSAFKYIYENRK